MFKVNSKYTGMMSYQFIIDFRQFFTWLYQSDVKMAMTYSVFFLSKSDWNAEILLLIIFCFNVILIITYATSFTFSCHTLLLWSLKSFKNVCYCYKHGTIIDTFLYIYIFKGGGEVIYPRKIQLCFESNIKKK